MVRAVIIASALVALIASVAAAPSPHGSVADIDIKDSANDVINVDDINADDIANDNQVLDGDNGSGPLGDILGGLLKRDGSVIPITRLPGQKHTSEMAKEGGEVNAL